jgi:hypothetical protein
MKQSMDSPTTALSQEVGPSSRSLEREISKLRQERDAAINQLHETQGRLSALKAELDKERGSRERVAATRDSEKERQLRKDLEVELAKSEAGWRERIRNERLIRLSYERILINLGFAPNRIAADLVQVSRPQPLSSDPKDYETVNLLDIDEAVRFQSQSKQKGLFAAGTADSRNAQLEEAYEAAPVVRVGSGKRELLKSLALSSIPSD